VASAGLGDSALERQSENGESTFHLRKMELFGVAGCERLQGLCINIRAPSLTC